MAQSLFTIGYERTELHDIVRTLREQGIEEVVDVRLTPISRRRGFSKSALAESLAKHGIEYSHRRELGCPKSIREQYKQTGDFARYATAYFKKVIALHEAELQDLLLKAKSRSICLLCFEADAARCHRSLVASQVVNLGKRRIRSIDLQITSSDRKLRVR